MTCGFWDVLLWLWHASPEERRLGKSCNPKHSEQARRAESWIADVSQAFDSFLPCCLSLQPESSWKVFSRLGTPATANRTEPRETLLSERHNRCASEHREQQSLRLDPGLARSSSLQLCETLLLVSASATSIRLSKTLLEKGSSEKSIIGIGCDAELIPRPFHLASHVCTSYRPQQSGSYSDARR